jgi:GNAT superfamily N-acetyltransferase
MSLYAEYIKEREGKDIVESEKGFATYQIFDNGDCYIQDIYVAPEFRKTGLAVDMQKEIAQIAKEKGCSALMGSISLDDKNASRNLRIMLNENYIIHNTIGTMIFLKKDIK